MQTVNYSTARNSLKKYCDKANKGETYIHHAQKQKMMLNTLLNCKNL